MDKGEIAWQVAHGETPDNVRNNPALKGMTIPRTGQNGLIGVLTTKTLVIAGEPLFTTTAPGCAERCCALMTRPPGRKSGACIMPAPQSGSPMTYMLDGQQYIVIAVSGRDSRENWWPTSCQRRTDRKRSKGALRPALCPGAPTHKHSRRFSRP